MLLFFCGQLAWPSLQGASQSALHAGVRSLHDPTCQILPLHVMPRRELLACCWGRGGALLRQTGSDYVALVPFRSFPGLAAAQVGRRSMGSTAAGCALRATIEADQESSGEGCCRVLCCFCWAVTRCCCFGPWTLRSFWAAPGMLVARGARISVPFCLLWFSAGAGAIDGAVLCKTTVLSTRLHSQSALVCKYSYMVTSRSWSMTLPGQYCAS